MEKSLVHTRAGTVLLTSASLLCQQVRACCGGIAPCPPMPALAGLGHDLHFCAVQFHHACQQMLLQTGEA
eukprot:880822-Amphidinium_carterae.1